MPDDLGDHAEAAAAADFRLRPDGRFLAAEGRGAHPGSGEDRVVLIFDVWRPELSEQERFELTALFSD